MKVAVLGNGGFGTAIAVLLAQAGREVALWGHDRAYTEQLARYLTERGVAAERWRTLYEGEPQAE